jgi:restriction endonuclease Mrr
MSEVKLPATAELRDALLKVLAGSPDGLTTPEIDKAVAAELNLSADQLALIRSGNRTEFAYRLAWERTHAKAKGLILRTSSRTWKIV